MEKKTFYPLQFSLSKWHLNKRIFPVGQLHRGDIEPWEQLKLENLEKTEQTQINWGRQTARICKSVKYEYAAFFQPDNQFINTFIKTSKFSQEIMKIIVSRVPINTGRNVEKKVQTVFG